MPKVSPNYALMKRLLAEGWNGEEFNGNKQICASLLLCSRTIVEYDNEWYENEFMWMPERNFEFVWDLLRQRVQAAFADICLVEMSS